MSEKKYDSFVIFKFHTNLVGEKYKQFIYNTLENFLYSVDSVTDKLWLKQLAEHCEWNEETPWDLFYVDDIFITHIKCYLYDEMDDSSPKQIVFRDHYSESAVKRVFLVSDAFEKFLNDGEIDFSRHNLLR